MSIKLSFQGKTRSCWLIHVTYGVDKHVAVWITNRLYHNESVTGTAQWVDQLLAESEIRQETSLRNSAFSDCNLRPYNKVVQLLQHKAAGFEQSIQFIDYDALDPPFEGLVTDEWSVGAEDFKRKATKMFRVTIDNMMAFDNKKC